MLRRKRRKDAGEILGNAATGTETGTGTGTGTGVGAGFVPGDGDTPGPVHVPAAPNDFDINAFDVVLVDPPRAGLDPDTLELVSRFDVVLYISCDPEALWRNANDGGRGHGGGPRGDAHSRAFRGVRSLPVHQARRVRIVLGAEARIVYGEMVSGRERCGDWSL